LPDAIDARGTFAPGVENTRVPSNETIKSLIRNTVPRSVRNWLRSPAKSLEWLSDSAQFFLGITKTLEFPPDIRIAMHPHAYKIACMSQIAEPEERAEFDNFISYCTPGMFFFDIGAHYGLFSLVAAHFDGRAVAVDPSEIAIRMIERQIALNHAEMRVRPLHAAVSDSSGLVEMLSSGVFSAGYFKFAKGRSARELTKVRAVTIDEMTREFGVPTHIKIDVEGHEAAALRGGHDTFTRFSPTLFLELHNEMVAVDGGDPSAALDELRRIGYAAFSLAGEELDRETIFKKPITRIVARRLEADPAAARSSA
jgi:FkbM family methyltransferase